MKINLKHFQNSIINQPKNAKQTKIILATLLLILVSTIVVAFKSKTDSPKPETSDKNNSSPIGSLGEPSTYNEAGFKKEGQVDDTVSKIDPNSLTIFGSDSRGPWQGGFRSDVMLNIITNPSKKKALIVSIPRDLWVDGQRINGYISTDSPEVALEKIGKVLGRTPAKFLKLDFDFFVDSINLTGGININVPVSFVDEEYPMDRDASVENKTISFEAGQQKLSGERALEYVRSRKGSNGEGSDFRRMQRQQQILVEYPKNFMNIQSILNPFVSGSVYNLLVSRTNTNLTLEDISKIHSLIQENGYSIEKLVLDDNFLYNPPMDQFGGSWVLRPKDEKFKEIHQEISRLVD